MVETHVGTGLSFSVLGALAADREGRPIELGAPKQRAVLALLLSNPNRPIGVGQIITDIWGSDASETFRRSVQTYVSNLRAVLDTEVPRSGDTYMLAIDPSRIDAVRFEAILEEATGLMATDPALAAGRLRDALAMWRGRPYADVADVEGLQTEINRLDELRLTAVELRIDAELAGGRHRELIAEVEALADDHPLRERFRAQHMIALYRSGRQTDALRVFQRTREYLTEELGIDPSQELQDLELAILRHDHELIGGTGLATTQRLSFLATSITDLNEAWDRNPQEMGESVWRLNEAITRAVGAHGGRVFHESGEGLDAVFTEATASVLAAEEAQREIAATDWEGLEPLAAGIAVDVGEAESRGDRFSGPPVTRARRLASKAWGGQVLLSSAIQTELASSSISGLQTRQLGEYELEGFARPEGIAQLVVDGLASDFDGPRPDERSVDRDGSASFSLPGYEIRELIGRGAVGAVYRAYQPSVGREVAIKVIRPTMSNHPRFFHRFETEARVIARLAHPRIVPLIDFWRDAEGAYLVLQYMPGRSVGDALERGTLDPESAHRIIRHVSQALEHAHDMGVAHGDVNPNNILLDESGNAYLADFDIASRLLAPEPEAAGVSTQADFRAPELGESGPTPAADIYAVGRLIETVVDRSAVRLVVERANRADPAERFANVRDLLEAFEEAIGGDTPPPPVLTRNPYKGLRPFEEADAADFHGREGLVSELIAELRWSKFVAVVGPSGSGKSSVVRAGVLPAIAKGAIDGAENWPTLQMTPGTRPLEVLADGVDALATGAAPPSRSLQRDGLSGAAEAILKDLEGELLVIVDQFEEAFTMLDAETRQSFIDLIVDAIEEEASRVRVIITLRADLYDLPLLDERLGPWLRASQVTVVPPTRDELIDMITAPGRNAGLEFARHLPGRIADDVIGRPGGLPLLQYALTEMIENRDSDLIDGDDYERVGGVAGALATRAEAVYRGLPSRLRDQARRVMLRLVAVDETGPPVRRRARLVELESLGLTRDDLELIISPYVAQRMLLADRDPTTRGPTVEVAHEALLREWPRLRNWIEDERESLVLSQKLRSAQREWETAEENPDFLLRGSHLARYLPLLRSESLTSGELDYLRRSRDRDRADQRKRRRRRRLVSAVLAGTAAAGLLLAAFATAQSRRAAEAADVARSRELASAAIGVLDRDPELSVLLATEAVTLAEPTFESVAALHEALYKHRLIWTVQWEGDTDFFTGALSPEGTRLALSGVGGVEVWDIATRRLVWRLPLPDGLHVRPFFSADGRELVGLVGWPRLSPAWDQPPGGVEPGIYRWGIETGEEIVAITDLPCPIWDMGQYGSAVDPTVPVAVAGFAETTDGGCDHSTGAVSLVDLDSGAITAMASIDSLATYSSSLSTTPDGKLVSFVDDGEGRVIDTVTGDVTLPIPLDVVSLTLTPDGSSAVVRDTVGRLTLWDLESGALQSQFGIGRGERFALNEEGSLVFHYDHTGEVEVWETEFGKPVASLVGGPPPPSRLVMGAVPTSLSRGDRVATFGDDGSARVWSTTPIAEVTSIPIGIGFVTAGSLTFSADRASLLIYQDVEETGSAPIFDPRSGEVVAEIDGVGAQAVRLSPDGRYLAGQAMSDGELGPIEVHNLVTGKVTVMDGLCRWELGTQFKNPAPCVPYPGSPFQDFARNIEFSPDSSLVALSGAGTGSVTVWDRASGELVHKSGRLMRHTENDPSFDGPTIAFAPDGGELAVATRDELLIIETDDWTISRRGDVERFIRIAYTPDGTKLIGATPTSEIQILDPAEIAVAGNIEGHRGRIHGIDVSPNGEMVASSSIDGVVMVWDIDNGMPLQAIPLGDELQNVAFLDSDHLLVTPQSGPSALVMTLNVAELIGVAQNRVTRDFTTEECQVYLHLDACPDGGGSPSLSEP